MKIFLVLCLLILLSGCATPVGKIPEFDFVWQEKIIEVNYQEVYRRIVKGFQSCGDIGIAEGHLYTDIKRGNFVVYENAAFGGRGDYVLGTISIMPYKEEKAIIKVGVRTLPESGGLFGRQGSYRKVWLKFADGDFNCEP